MVLKHRNDSLNKQVEFHQTIKKKIMHSKAINTQNKKAMNSMEVLQKNKNITTLSPSNYTIRYLTNGYKNGDSKDHMHPNVYSCAINNSQTMETTQMSMDL